MIEITFELMFYAALAVLGIVFVAAILNRQVIADILALKKSVKAGTGMAVDKAVNFFDGDGDGDVDLDDLKFIASNLDVKTLKGAILAELKQLEYAEAGVAISPEKQKNTGLMFKEAVSKKSGEE